MVLNFGANLFDREVDLLDKTGTKIISIPGSDFNEIDNLDFDNVKRSIYGEIIADGSTLRLVAGVQLPHNATILSAVVYGTDATEDWDLYSNDWAGGVGTSTNIATGTINTAAVASTAQNRNVVDNANQKYILRTDIDDTEEVYGASITYIEGSDR